MPTKNDNILNALSSFCQNNYQMDFKDSLNERFIYDKNGNEITNDNYQKKLNDNTFITVKNNKALPIYYNSNTNDFEFEKKKDLNQFSDKDSLKWYKLIIAFMYLLFKAIKNLINTIISLVNPNLKKSCEKALKNKFKFDKKREREKLLDERLKNLELSNESELEVSSNPNLDLKEELNNESIIEEINQNEASSLNNDLDNSNLSHNKEVLDSLFNEEDLEADFSKPITAKNAQELIDEMKKSLNEREKEINNIAKDINNLNNNQSEREKELQNIKSNLKKVDLKIIEDQIKRVELNKSIANLTNKEINELKKLEEKDDLLIDKHDSNELDFSKNIVQRLDIPDTSIKLENSKFDNPSRTPIIIEELKNDIAIPNEKVDNLEHVVKKELEANIK